MTWAPALLLVPALALGAGILDPGVGPAAPDLSSSAPLTASLGDREEDAQADLEKAEAAARKGKHRAAQVGYERLAKKYPDTAAGKVAARRASPSGFLGWDWVVQNGDPANRNAVERDLRAGRGLAPATWAHLLERAGFDVEITPVDNDPRIDSIVVGRLG